jgi:hypothetical protein
MHQQAFEFVATVARAYQARGPVYEIGSRNINGSVRALFHDVGLYLGVDVASGPGVDLVADGATYAPPIVPRTVVCCEVLEHTADAHKIVAQAATVLEPGGLLIITCAGEGRVPHSAWDGGPLRAGEYYRNLSFGDLERWASAAGVDALRMAWSENPGDTYYVGRKKAA